MAPRQAASLRGAAINAGGDAAEVVAAAVEVAPGQAAGVIEAAVVAAPGEQAAVNAAVNEVFAGGTPPAPPAPGPGAAPPTPPAPGEDPAEAPALTPIQEVVVAGVALIAPIIVQIFDEAEKLEILEERVAVVQEILLNIIESGGRPGAVANAVDDVLEDLFPASPTNQTAEEIAGLP